VAGLWGVFGAAVRFMCGCIRDVLLAPAVPRADGFRWSRCAWPYCGGLPREGEQFGDGLLVAGIPDPVDRDDGRDCAAPGVQPAGIQSGGGR
jgi:hypothetical protein